MASRGKTVKGAEEFSAKLAGLAGNDVITVMKAAVYAGAEIIADQVKAEIQNLPEQSGYMPEGKKRNVIGTNDKRMMQERLGISHMKAEGDKVSLAVGFNGYNDRPTKKYPRGVPIPLIARSIESGSSVREKNPFIRRAFNACKSRAQAAMNEAADKEIQKINNK